MKIIGATILRNERSRWLERWAQAMLALVDVLVVPDDASDDGSPDVLRRHGPRVVLHRSDTAMLLVHETLARARLWEAVREVAKHDDWVALFDADEVPSATLSASRLRGLPVSVERLDAKLLELWDDSHWRLDGWWSPWLTFFVRFRDVPFAARPDAGPTFHASRLPEYAADLVPEPLDPPVLHLAYGRQELRAQKAEHYLARNTGVNLAHAHTILSPPTLRPLASALAPADILLCIPIRNRAWMVPHLTASLDALHMDPARVEIQLLVNDSTDETAALLGEWASRSHRNVRVETVSLPDPVAAGGNRWWGPPHDPEGPLRRMTRLRNDMLRRLQASGADALLALDSDVLMDPRTPGHLLATGEDVVSPVFWARWDLQTGGPILRIPDGTPLRRDVARTLTEVRAGKWPQVWERGQYDLSEDFIVDLIVRPGVRPVGGLGAVTLIRRAVADAGVTYDPIHNLPAEIVGEDRHFCIRAAVHGFRLAASTYLPTIHCDDPSDLPP